MSFRWTFSRPILPFVPVSFRRPFPRQPLEIRHRRAAFRHQLVRILVAQLVEAERATLGDLHRAGDSFGDGGVAAGDLVERPQVALGVGEETRARLGQRALRADARQHVLQVAPLGNVVVHVVGGDERDTGALRELDELGEADFVGHVVGQLGGEVQPVAEDFAVGVEGIKEGTRARRHAGTKGGNVLVIPKPHGG
jgi:hypothetical protein